MLYFVGIKQRKNITKNTDQLSIEWAGTYRHYHSAMFRTMPIGKADLNIIKCMMHALKH